MNNSNIIKATIVLTIGFIIWFMPHPEGVSTQAWNLFAIVLATILGLILQPLPIGAVAFIGGHNSYFNKSNEASRSSCGVF